MPAWDGLVRVLADDERTVVRLAEQMLAIFEPQRLADADRFGPLLRQSIVGRGDLTSA